MKEEAITMVYENLNKYGYSKNTIEDALYAVEYQYFHFDEDDTMERKVIVLKHKRFGYKVFYYDIGEILVEFCEEMYSEGVITYSEYMDMKDIHDMDEEDYENEAFCQTYGD